MVYYNLSTYMTSVTQMLELTNRSWSMCSRLRQFKHQCEGALTSIEHKVNEIDNNNKLFMLREDRRSTFCGILLPFVVRLNGQ